MKTDKAPINADSILYFVALLGRRLSGSVLKHDKLFDNKSSNIPRLIIS